MGDAAYPIPSNLPRIAMHVEQGHHGNLETEVLAVDGEVGRRFLLVLVVNQESFVRELVIDAPQDARLHAAWVNDHLTLAAPDGLETGLWASGGERKGFIRNVFGGEVYAVGATFTFELTMREAGMIRVCLECDELPARAAQINRLVALRDDWFRRVMVKSAGTSREASAETFLRHYPSDTTGMPVYSMLPWGIHDLLMDLSRCSLLPRPRPECRGSDPEEALKTLRLMVADWQWACVRPPTAHEKWTPGQSGAAVLFVKHCAYMSRTQDPADPARLVLAVGLMLEHLSCCTFLEGVPATVTPDIIQAELDERRAAFDRDLDRLLSTWRKTIVGAEYGREDAGIFRVCLRVTAAQLRPLDLSFSGSRSDFVKIRSVMLGADYLYDGRQEDGLPPTSWREAIASAGLKPLVRGDDITVEADAPEGGATLKVHLFADIMDFDTDDAEQDDVDDDDSDSEPPEQGVS
ncbi:MAG: hypothetical protein EPN91_00880 [Salinibacterium sp.]|nr:MAG: hypothetical protein EPN91_00880 [Salinibacterium sp.]